MEKTSLEELCKATDRPLLTLPSKKKKKILAMSHPKEAWPSLSGAHWIGAQSPKAGITDASLMLPKDMNLLPFWSTSHTMKPLGSAGWGAHFLLKMFDGFQRLGEGLGAPTLADPQSRAGQGQALMFERSSPSIRVIYPTPAFLVPEPSLLLSPAWACCLFLPQTFPTSSSLQVTNSNP